MLLPPAPRLWGRAALLDAVESRLADDDAPRVTTLWGPGGVGKTSLAIGLAHRVASSFDTVVFVALASADDEGAMLAAIARALGVTAPDGASAAVLGSSLESRGRALVVLDNVEQVIAPAALAVTSLAAAPRARFLVSSREPLSIGIEEVVRVPPLAVPSDDGAVAASDAAELLLVRARAVRADFQATPAELRRLVALSEGLPLAIELIAAHLDVLGARELADRVASGAAHLTSPRRDIDERHRSLDAALEVSLRLLGPTERSVLAELAIFRGAFDAVAVESVSADGASALGVLRALVRKSLVRALPQSEGAPRFALFESVRVAALRSHPIDAAARERYAAWVAGAAYEAMRRSRSADGARALAELSLLADDLAAVLTRFAESGEGAAAAPRACHALFELASVRGPIEGFIDLVQRVVVARAGAPESAALRVHLAAALALNARSEEATRVLSEARRALSPTTDPVLHARALVLAAELAVQASETERAVQLATEAVAVASAAGDDVLAAAAEQALGTARYYEADYAAARRHCERALILHRRAGDARGEARTLSRIGFMSNDEARAEEARTAFERSLALFESLGDERLAGYARGYLGNVLRAEGKHDAALAAYHEALTAMRRTGDRSFAAVFSMDRGIARLLVGDADGALVDFDDASRLLAELRNPYVEGLVLAYRATAEARRGNRQRAMAAMDEARARSVRAATRCVPYHERIVALSFGGAADATLARDARAWLTNALRTPPTNEHERIARRLLASALDHVAPSDDAVVIDGARLRLPGGATLDLTSHASLLRMVLALADAHESGLSLRTPDLLRAGWPGEKVAPKAGALRVRVGIAQLRKLGLRALLEHDTSGYRLARGVPIVRKAPLA